jgi:hypothetical protein
MKFVFLHSVTMLNSDGLCRSQYNGATFMNELPYAFYRGCKMMSYKLNLKHRRETSMC